MRNICRLPNATISANIGSRSFYSFWYLIPELLCADLNPLTELYIIAAAEPA